MIESIDRNAIILVSNDSPLIFDNDDLRTKSASCCGWLQHNENSPVYRILEGGVYELNFSGNITSLTPGVVALGISQDGEIINNSIAISNIAVAGDYENLSIKKKIKVCCKGGSIISVVSVPNVPVYSAITPVNTETQVPIITNATFSIDRIC